MRLRLALIVALIASPVLAQTITPISGLTAGSAIVGAEAIPMVQSATTKKTTPSALLTYIQGALAFTGDCSLSSAAITCTKTSGTAFAYFATGTDASHLTGTVSVNRFNSGTSASSSTFLRGDGTWVTPTAGAGTVTTTGTPASGNLTKFSGATSVTNGDLAGDVTTSGTLTTTVAKIAGTTVSGTSGTGNVAFTTSPAFTTPDLGTPSAATLTNATGLPIVNGTTGTLTVARGGTNCGSASITCFNNITGFSAAGTTGTTSTNLVFSTSPALTTPDLGTPSAVVLTSGTGLPLSTGVTGQLKPANHTGSGGAYTQAFLGGI